MAANTPMVRPGSGGTNWLNLYMSALPEAPQLALEYSARTAAWQARQATCHATNAGGRSKRASARAARNAQQVAAANTHKAADAAQSRVAPGVAAQRAAEERARVASLSAAATAHRTAHNTAQKGSTDSG
jgi:hypothetical protein